MNNLQVGQTHELEKFYTKFNIFSSWKNAIAQFLRSKIKDEDFEKIDKVYKYPLLRD